MLYGGKPPSQLHSETSREAAEQISVRLNPLQRQVLVYLIRQAEKGATDEEMQEVLEMSPNTQRPRRRELQLSGVVVDSGVKRLTNAKRRAVVWRINADQSDVPGL